MITHNTFIVPGVVDGAVAHKQAWDRLANDRWHSEPTIVHEHKVNIPCNPKCTIYHKDLKTNEPHSHPINEECPNPVKGV